MRKEWLFRLGLFALVMVLFGAFAPLSIDLYHDGVMLKPAMDVASGQVIFRDTFSLYGAFTTFFQALAVKLWGGELLVIKWQTVFFYALSAVMLDVVYARFLTRFFRGVTLVLFVGLAPFYLVIMHPWASVYALLFMLVATEFVLRFEERGRNIDLFIAGVSAAFAFGCRQPCGMVVAVGIAMALAAQWYFGDQKFQRLLRHLAILLAGIAIVIVPFLLYLWVNRAEQDYWIQSFDFASRFGWQRGGSGDLYNILITFLPYDSNFVIFPLAALTVFILALRQLWQKNAANDLHGLQIFTVAVLALASYHQYYPVPCVRHLYWSAIPMFGVFAYLLQLLWQRPWSKTCRVTVLALLLVYPASAVCYRMYHGAERLTAPRQTVDIAGLHGMKLHPQEVNYYLRMQKEFARIPAEFQKQPYVNFTPDALLCIFFPTQINPHPVFVNWDNRVYSNYTEQMRQFVAEHHPVIIGVRPIFDGYVPVAGFPSIQPQYFIELYTGAF